MLSHLRSLPILAIAIAMAFAMTFVTSLLPAVAQTVDESSSQRLERRIHLMGTDVAVEVIAADRSTALLASTLVVSALENTEDRLSTWREDSELSRLNRTPAKEWIQLSTKTIEELALAESCRQLTLGAFDPAIGGLVDLWQLRGAGYQPSDDEISTTRPRAEWPAMELDFRKGARRGYETLRFEEGAFGKGAGAKRALQAISGLSDLLSVRLDLGGQITWWVHPDLVSPAKTERIADPRDRSRAVIEVEPRPQTQATSGNSTRGIVVNGRRLGHLLDPRTGQPAPDFGSLTVWADDPLLADCLSTGLYVLGPETAITLAESIPGVEVLALVSDGATPIEAIYSSGLAGRLLPLVDNLDLSHNPAPVKTPDPAATKTSQVTRSDEPLPARNSAHRFSNSRPPAR